ncbi:spore coat protein [Caldanaerobacter sp.]|uniref:spore coat protein n=1 Tax=Caldanaerobacter sp. TaxID=2930036 RepID=UPI003C76BDB8
MYGNQQITDKEIMMNILGSYKLAIEMLSHAAVEAANESIRREYINLLNSTLEDQRAVWTAVNQRGWYPVKAAQPQDIQEARNKFKQPVGMM